MQPLLSVTSTDGRRKRIERVCATTNLSKIAKCQMCRQSPYSCSHKKFVLHCFLRKSIRQSQENFIDLKKNVNHRFAVFICGYCGRDRKKSAKKQIRCWWNGRKSGGSASWEKTGGNKEGEGFLDGAGKALQFQSERSLATEKPVYIEGRQRSVIDRAIDVFQGPTKLKAPASSGLSRV